MSAALNNVATSDGYSTAATLQCPGAVRLVLTVLNAAVYWRRGIADVPGGQAAYIDAEALLVPGTYSLPRRADAVQFRSAVAGTPARVTVEAMAAGELGA